MDEVVIASVSPHAWFVAAGVVENITDQVEPPEVTATSHKDPQAVAVAKTTQRRFKWGIDEGQVTQNWVYKGGY